MSFSLAIFCKHAYSRPRSTLGGQKMRYGFPTTRREHDRFYTINDDRRSDGHKLPTLYRPTIDRIHLGMHIEVWGPGNRTRGGLVEKIDNKRDRILIRTFIGGTREHSFTSPVLNVAHVRWPGEMFNSFNEAYADYQKWNRIIGAHLDRAEKVIKAHLTPRDDGADLN
jgi:hypothetical protein